MLRKNYESYFEDDLKKSLKNIINIYCHENSLHSLEEARVKCKENIYDIIRSYRGLSLFLINHNQFGEIANIFNQAMVQYDVAYTQLDDADDFLKLADVMNKVITLVEAFANTCKEIRYNFPENISEYYSQYNDRHWNIFCSTTGKLFKNSNQFVNILEPFAAADRAKNKDNTTVETNYDFDKNNALFGNISYKLYGVETINYDAQLYDKFLNAPLDDCCISPKAFDAAIAWYETSFITTHTISNFKRMVNYVKTDGAVVLHGNLENVRPLQLRTISSCLHDFHLYIETPNLMNFGYTGYFILIGRRKPLVEFKLAEFNQLLDMFMKPEDIINKLFTFSGSNVIVDKFRTDSLEESDFLKGIAQISEFESKLTNELLSSNINKDDRRPLLPFSAGQLGLILVSGSIDGKIQENDDVAHVVKGYPHQTSQENYEDVFNSAHELIGQKRIITHYNASAVTIITPSGTIKRLT